MKKINLLLSAFIISSVYNLYANDIKNSKILGTPIKINQKTNINEKNKSNNKDNNIKDINTTKIQVITYTNLQNFKKKLITNQKCFLGYCFKTKKAKEYLEVVKKDYSKCIKTNSDIIKCRKEAKDSLKELEKYDIQQAQYLYNKKYKIYSKIFYPTIFRELRKTKEFKELKKLKSKCLSYTKIEKIKKCFKENLNKMKDLRKKIKEKKQQIIKKLESSTFPLVK